MQLMRIKSPNNGAEFCVRAWDIVPRDILNKFKTGEYKSARDLSWALLSDTQSTQLMEDTLDKDSAPSNFALHVFENALDWNLGIVVTRIIKDALKQKRIPKPFKVAVDRRGDVWTIHPSGTVIAH